MADFNCEAAVRPDPDYRAYVPDQAVNAHSRTYSNIFQGAVVPSSPPINGGEFAQMSDREDGLHSWIGQLDSAEDFFFFERIHHTPQLIELGNVLTSVVEEIEIYNAYRDDSQTFTSAIANAGAGIEFAGLPSLPAEMSPQSGVVFDVEISTEGPPSIDGTLDFVTDPASFDIPITGSRVVMFAFQPERPILEILKFKTDTIMAADGTEQRISQRLNPRQSFEMALRLPEGDERRRALTLLKGWHHRVFGVPIWWEARPLGADVNSGSSIITVPTAHADFRVGSLAIVWSDSDYFDALQIASFDGSSITFESNLTHDFDAVATLVMPLRVAYAEAAFDIQRYLNDLQDVRCRFDIIDNEVGDIADTSNFSSHNSKVMLDDYNLIDGRTLQDNFHRELQRIDNATAAINQFSTWESSVPVTQKGFLGNSLQDVWEVRELIHALRGSQVSFYLPTFYKDFVVVQDLASTSFLMDIENIGYSGYINGVEPFKSIWIELNNGTIYTRQVESSVVIDANTERLTVDVAWPSLIDKDDIYRVSLLRKVRIADDAIQFLHELPGTARIRMNIRGAP